MDLNKIIVEPQPTRNGSKLRTWFVKYHGTVIGYLEKYRPEKGYIHPWKAFAVDGAASMRPNTMLGVYYDAEHGGNANAKQKAIAAVIIRHQAVN